MKKILLVIDMQNDFISGALGTREAQAITPMACAKIAGWDGDIYATLDTHGADYLTTAEGKMLPVVHCQKGTDGWKLAPSVEEALLEHSGYLGAIEKPTFGSRILADKLLAGEYDEIELIGVCTDICVISNALLARAALPNATITVDANCCAGVTPDRHNTALEAMKCCNIAIA